MVFLPFYPLAGAFGGSVTAWGAPASPMRYSAVLAALLLASVSLLGFFAHADDAKLVGWWVPLAVGAAAALGALAGGGLLAWRRSARGPAATPADPPRD